MNWLRSPENDTLAGARRAKVMDVMGNAMAQPEVDLQSSEILQVEWRGQQFRTGQMPPLLVVREILWELYELNFRAELLALDARACSPTDAQDSAVRQELVCACFPSSSSALTVEFLRSNEGLAADDWYDRLPYVLALCRVMSSWVASKPAAFSIAEKGALGTITEADFHRLEQAVASFYTQNFFDWFGRAAVVLHRLHPPSNFS
jgi:hypothetical protein